VYSGGGADTSAGGGGSDHVWGMAKVDVSAPGFDTLNGGRGGDTIHARDGEADQINCGPGNDRAVLDMLDVVDGLTPDLSPGKHAEGSCERVVRRDPKSTDPTEPTT
jgi:hypothetical protein